MNDNEGIFLTNLSQIFTAVRRTVEALDKQISSSHIRTIRKIMPSED